MFELAAVTYGALATYVLASVTRNRREDRRDPAVLTAFGMLLMTFSASMAVLLLGYMAWSGLDLA
jgi:hypothetical protein